MTQPAAVWVVDPEDPRAPPTEIWERLTPEQRAAVIEALPSEFPASEVSPPEGVAGNLPIYYPGERMFSPDLIAVDGAEQRQRDSWIVDAEGGKGSTSPSRSSCAAIARRI